MEYRLFKKKLALPVDFAPPRELFYEDIVAQAITRSHVADDVRGINASLELIRRTRGGPWPTGPVTEDYNFDDLVWHEVEFRDASSFTYAVYKAGDQYIGCCYLYPMGGRTQLTDELLDRDVDVSWWVTPAAYEHGYYAKLYAALQTWLANEFSFWQPHYSNAEIPR
jgi:hypothetical protein